VELAIQVIPVNKGRKVKLESMDPWETKEFRGLLDKVEVKAQPEQQDFLASREEQVQLEQLV